jgi:hypothetical protein
LQAFALVANPRLGLRPIEIMAKIQEIHHETPPTKLEVSKTWQILNLQCSSQNVVVPPKKQHWDLLP